MTSQPLRSTVTAVAVSWCLVASAHGQHGTGPTNGFDTDADKFVDVKSPPLKESDTWGTLWSIHINDNQGPAPGGVSNYAGFLFDLQYDGGEVSSLTMFPSGPHAVFSLPGGGVADTLSFAGSDGNHHTVQPLAVWVDPAVAVGSGTFLPNSQVTSLFFVEFHAKNTTPANNSDLDIHISQLGVIRHNVDQGVVVTLQASDWVYLVANQPGASFAPFGQGTWVHLSDTTIVTNMPPSAFYATARSLGEAASYGIEHVPEPASFGLLIAGAACCAVGRFRRSV